ncbi:hypothetical protein [Fretibacter rubidus]|uniref:CC0125/CC1285 family lipoprotein n=1 Tax=Fretibacter rubidus TaxID=570162 RepID=UPI003529F895
MRHIFISSLAILGLSACPTGPSAYGPATSSNGLGFNNTQIEQDRFRIRYTGRNIEEAQDYALLRASEIALAEGYSHFRIIGGTLSDNNRGGSPVRTSVGIGLGSGRGYYGRRGGTNVNVGIGVNDIARALQGDKVTNSIEVRLLRSGGEDTYNARSVADSIRPAVFTGPASPE